MRSIAVVLACALSMVPSSSALAQAIPPAVPEPSAELAGHYYLSGIREMGSELLLRADGRYQWMLAYGALDIYAEGEWRRVGAQVLLLAKDMKVGAPDAETDAQMRKAFGHMTLDIEGDVLLPQELGGGRYTRP